jgi:hypothetical protein
MNHTDLQGSARHIHQAQAACRATDVVGRCRDRIRGRGAMVAPRSVAGGALEGGSSRGQAQLSAEEAPDDSAPRPDANRALPPAPAARKGEDGKGRSGPPVSLSSGPTYPRPPAAR